MTDRHRRLRRLYAQLVPEVWAQRIHLLRGGTDVFLPCFRDSGSVFIHVPRAAGTSVSRAIYGINVGHRRAMDYHAISGRHFRSYFRFAFVRDPWDRAVSAYEFARQGGTDLVKPIPDVDYAGSKFNSFESFAHEWLPAADLEQVDVVFRPQSDFVCGPDGELLVDFVGRVEQLSAGIAEVGRRLGVDLQPAHLNRSERSADYRDYYDHETAAIIGDVYSRDIDLFGYEFAA